METEFHIGHFVRYRRQQAGLTQEQLAAKAGVGLRFIRDIEQGKESLRMDKVKQVLSLFGRTLGPVPDRILDPYYVLQHFFNRTVTIFLRNKKIKVGALVEPIDTGLGITDWMFLSNNNLAEYNRSKDATLLEKLSHNQIEDIQLNEHATLR